MNALWLFGLAGALCVWAIKNAQTEQIETKFINQPLDHYNPSQIFKQKVLIGKSHWKGNGYPILLFVVHHGSAEMFARYENTGFLWDYAKQSNGMLVFAEHRYSEKPREVDPGQLKYVSLNQTLADLARIIGVLKRELYEAEQSPVIVVGAGLGGTLAAYLRMRYPESVIGAVASSAPMLAPSSDSSPRQLMEKELFAQYYKSYENCGRNVEKSFEALKNLDEEGKLDQVLELCEQPKSVEQVRAWLLSLWHLIVACPLNHPSDLYASLPERTLVKTCTILQQDPRELSDLQLMQRVNEVVRKVVYQEGDERRDCIQSKNLLYPYLFPTDSGMTLEVPFGYYRGHSIGAPLNVLGDVTELFNHSKIIFTLPFRNPYSGWAIKHSIPENSIYSLPVQHATWMEELRASNTNDFQYIQQVRNTLKDNLDVWISEHRNHLTKAHYDRIIARNSIVLLPAAGISRHER